MRQVSGFRELVGTYDIFLLDQWGVIHDGENLLPGAREMFAKLHEHGKDVVLISNSGKRSHDSHSRLEKLEIPREHYIDVVTSGETAYRALRDRSTAFHQNLGKRFYIYTWPEDGDRAIIEGLGFEEVDSLESANFILFAGVDRPNVTAYQTDLEKALSLNLPMICANPDLVSLRPDGSEQLCPGSIAHAYEDMGGSVRWHGKPQKDMYETCLDLVKDRKSKKVVCVGDSLQHDIAGANLMGLESVFIMSGIHKDALDFKAPEEGLASLVKHYDARPDWLAQDFVW